MNKSRHDLGVAQRLKAEALGVPGQRTFRILVEAERGSATIWMEKQQLSALALSIKGFIRELGEHPQGVAPTAAPRPAKEPYFDFKASNLGLGYDEGRSLFAVLAYDREDSESDTATLICWALKAEAEELADEALEIVVAGRPLCSLCGGPIDPEGHMCPRSNGHGPVVEHL